MIMYFFFFQAEDGIRDIGVTGVQTCALPISSNNRGSRRWTEAARRVLRSGSLAVKALRGTVRGVHAARTPTNSRSRPPPRSEERRVGKEGKSRWSPYHLKKKTKDE